MESQATTSERVAEAVKTALRDKGWDQKTLAIKLSVSESTMSRMLEGGRWPIDRVELACQILGIDLIAAVKGTYSKAVA